MRSIFIATMILFLLTACGADAQPAAPTVTVTIPATFTLTPTKAPTATNTPVESQLPEGTRIDVDTAKEGWVDEFPGLEEHVRTNEDGTTSFVLGDMVLLDLDGKVMTPEKTEFDYNPEGTIFKFAGEDKIWVGGWEFSKSADGKYEFVDAIRILAPRPDADGNVEDPANVLPHLNKEDTELMNLFVKQVANTDIYDDKTFDVSRRALTPSQFICRTSTGINVKYEFLIPVGEAGNQNKFAERFTPAGMSPQLIQLDKPSIYIQGLGTLFSLTILDQSGLTYLSQAVIQDSGYKKTVFEASKHNLGWLSLFLFGINTEPANETEKFLKENNTKLLKLIGKTNTADAKFNYYDENILNQTIFTTGYTKN